MKETVMTSVRVAYEPPYADIIEVAVERGFDVSFDPNYGTEGVGRDDVKDNSWHS